MYIASLAFVQRINATKDEWRSFGKLWWDAKEHRCSILLHGFYKGSFIAKPYPDVPEPPYIHGDLMVQTGEYEKGGAIKKKYLWIGYITSYQDETGQTAYTGILEVDPTPALTPVLIRRMISQSPEEQKGNSGMFVSVFLQDKVRNDEGQMPSANDVNKQFDEGAELEDHLYDHP